MLSKLLSFFTATSTKAEQAFVEGRETLSTAASSMKDKINPWVDHSHELDPIITSLQNPLSLPPSLLNDLTSFSQRHENLLNNESKAAIKYLTDCLNADIVVENETISEPTKKALYIVIAKLKTLKSDSTGRFATSSLKAKADPLLHAFQKNLDSLTQALINKSPEKILESAELILDNLKKIKESKVVTFYKGPLSEKDGRILEDLENKLLAYKNLPASLRPLIKYHQFPLHPSIYDLAISISDTLKIVTTQIGTQEGLLQSTIKSMSGQLEAVKECFTGIGMQLLGWGSKENPFTTFQTLYDAIHFLKKCGKGYTDQNKKQILLALIEECDHSSIGFKKTFLETIQKACPDRALSETWHKDHLLDSFLLLEKAFHTALTEVANIPASDKYPVTSLLNICESNATFFSEKTKERVQQNLQNASGNILTNYTQTLLEYFNVPILNKKAIFLFGDAFHTLLSQDRLTKWLNPNPKDSAESRASKNILRDIINQTKAAFKTAQASLKTDDYKEAITLFKKLYNEHHVVLGAIELPALFLDTAAIETQNNTIDGVDETLKELRALFNPTNRSEKLTEEELSKKAEELSKKIKKERNALGQNLQDLSTYKIFNKTKTDDNFYKIKEVEKDLPPQLQKTYFLDQLKKEIDNTSSNWFVKQTLKFFLPAIYRLLGRNIKGMLINFHEDLNSRLDHINKQDLLNRSNNCFSQYNALLKDWAAAPFGGEKNSFINSLMKSSDYLKYGADSYSQSELYAKIADSFINNYSDIYAGPNNEDASWSAFPSALKAKLDAFVKKPFFDNQRSGIYPFLNYSINTIKAVVFGLPTYLVIGSVLLITKTFDAFSNYFIKSCLKSFLKTDKTIDGLVDSSKNGIYDNNPYVYAITGSIADQLERLSKKLEDKDTLKSEGDKKTSFVIPDKTRTDIKTAFKHLFEILNKNKCNTQDELQQYLKNKGNITSLKESGEEFVLPHLVDSIMDIIVTAATELLTKESLQDPIALLFEKLNDILTSPKETDKSKLELELLRNKAAQEKLNKYSNKILKQVIDAAFDTVIKDVGHQEGSIAKDYTAWIEQVNKPDGLISLWRNDLTTLNQSSDDEMTKENTRYLTLEHLRKASDDFLTHLELRQDQLTDSSSRTSKELIEKSAPFIKNLKALLKGDKTGLIALYNSQKTIHETSQDLPIFEGCSRAYATLKTELSKLPNDCDNAATLKTIKAQITFLEKTLTEIQTKKLPLLKEEKNYAQLKTLIETHLQQRKKLANFLEKNTLQTLTELTGIEKFQQDQGNIFTRLLETKNHQLAHGSLFDFLNLGQDTFTPIYTELKKQIKSLHNKKNKELLMNLLNHVKDSTDALTTNNNVRLFQTQLNTLIEDEKVILKTKLDQLQTIDDTISTEIDTICGSFKTTLDKERANYDRILPTLKTDLTKTETSITEFSKLSFVYMTDGGVSNTLKKVSSPLAQAIIKPKMQAILDLLRDGNFAQFFINHTVLMPFVKK